MDLEKGELLHLDLLHQLQYQDQLQDLLTLDLQELLLLQLLDLQIQDLQRQLQDLKTQDLQRQLQYQDQFQHQNLLIFRL